VAAGLTVRAHEVKCAQVLPSAAWPVWLGEEQAELPEFKALLAPYPSDEMIVWPVSARVGNVKNNYPSLIEPVVLN
jgi:putative SOS response-associated peptidase YedK